MKPTRSRRSRFAPRSVRPAGAARRVVVAALCLFPGACGDDKPPSYPTSVIVLGFDGMDPKLTGEMMDSGRLPNFARLRDQGSFKPLQTVTPPQSPVAWASFATGLNPGGHGLFDFIHRDPAPADKPTGIDLYSAMSRTVPATSWLGSLFSAVLGDTLRWGDYDIPLQSGRHELLRHGRPFWEPLAEAGVPAWVYRLPANFPATCGVSGPLRALSDMGTPDLSDTMGEFSFYTSEPSFDAGGSITGGKVYPVRVVNGTVLPAEPVSTGTVQSMLSPTRVSFRPWQRLKERLDEYEGCELVFDRGADAAPRMHNVESVNVRQRVVTLTAPVDFDVKPGSLVKLIAPCSFKGPPNPVLRQEPTPRAEAVFAAYVDADNQTVCLEFNDQRVILAQGQWSGWYPVEFPLVRGWSTRWLVPPAHGICRFYLKSVTPHFALYVSPFNYDPTAPVIPLCYPSGFAADVAAVTGRYYTQGLPEDTKALSHHVLSRDEFLQQADIVEAERERLLDFALDRFNGGFLFFYYGGTDLVAHMFWGVKDPQHPGITDEERKRYHDAVERYYECADRMLGRVMVRRPQATILVISDHGFESFSRGVNLNTWLAENGYARMLFPSQPDMPLNNFDFSATTLYAVGLNGLYVNLKGREQNGIVDPADKQALLDEVKAKLLKLKDPKTGRHVVKEVYQSDRIYKGPYVGIAPDLQIGYARGFRGSWGTVLGCFPRGVVEDNLDPWGADHCIATDLVPGIVLSSRPIMREQPGLMDLAPTVLTLFGLSPAEADGRNIFE